MSRLFNTPRNYSFRGVEPSTTTAFVENLSGAGLVLFHYSAIGAGAWGTAVRASSRASLLSLRTLRHISPLLIPLRTPVNLEALLLFDYIIAHFPT